MKKQSGFTLIELLIVVALIGVLSAIGLMSYESITGKAERDRGCIMVAPQMAIDQAAHKTAFGTYTTDFAELNRVVKVGADWAAVAADTTFAHTYTMTPGTTGDIATSVVITCIPTKADVDGFDPSGCGNLTYDNFGRKGGAARPPKTVDACWR